MALSAEERAESRAKFVEYRRTGERKLRNELIEAHKSLASHLARRYANRGEPFDDLLQVAYLGMLKAVERFDPERNLEFSTYATVTVEGELKRHFRDKTWSVRVPRRPQELHLRLGSVINDLSQRLSRTPRVPEVAAELGVAEEEVLEAMEVGGAYRSSSLDTCAGESADPTSVERRLGTDDQGFDLAEHRVLLDTVLGDLTERERTIVELRFFHDKTQTEIAEEVGISQMHVSRLLAARSSACVSGSRPSTPSAAVRAPRRRGTRDIRLRGSSVRSRTSMPACASARPCGAGHRAG